MSPAPGAVRAMRLHGPAVFGYLALVVLFFWPVLTHFSSQIISDGRDGAFYLWNLWSIPRAILRGDSPFVTHDIFFPVGARTAFNTNMPLEGVLSWPLQQAFGLGVASNVTELAAAFFSGLGAYFLALHVCRDRRAAFVAGAAFAFFPYRFAHLSGHHSLNHLEFLPFGLLALLRLYETPTRRRAVIFGVVLGLTLLTELSYTIFLVIAVLVVMGWHWRRTVTREMALRLAQAGLAAILVGLPLLVPMAQELFVHHELDPLVGWGSADKYSADLLSWVTPSALQGVWGDRFLATDLGTTGGERLAFPGFAVLIMAAAGATAGARGPGQGPERPRDDQPRPGLWCAMAGVFFVLSLGPILHVAGRTGHRFSYLGADFTVPLPYFLLHFVPVLNGLRIPGRFSVVGILALDVLAALALARLAREHPRRGAVAAALALVILVAEFYPKPLATQAATVPGPYAAIAADPDPGAVLEIPIQWRSGFGTDGDPQGDHTLFMYYATEHGKPLAGGMAARYPRRKIDALLGIPVFRELLYLHEEPPIGDADFAASDLRRLGIGFVVYHRDRPRPSAERYLAGLGMPVLADDGTVEVWKVPPATIPTP